MLQTATSDKLYIRYGTPACLMLCYLFATGLVWWSQSNGFFWDTIQLGAKHATFFLENRFSTILLPNEMDSGHIPAFGWYLAVCWRLFGRSLEVSHWAMLPFAIGVVWQLTRLVQYFFDKKYVGLVVLLLLIDPSLLCQMTLVSPDIALPFFFLWAINATLRHQKWFLALAIFCLFLTSMRGMMVAFAVLLFDIALHIDWRKPWRQVFVALWYRSWIYLPAVLLFVGFNAYHYMAKGWIGYHAESPWAACFERVNLRGFGFNVGVLAWRLLDFGRIGLWLIVGLITFFYGKKIGTQKRILYIWSFFLVLLVVLTANMLWAKNLLAHRYLIPLFLAFAFGAVYLLFDQAVSIKIRSALVVVWLFFLITGNFWVYPLKTSQGWDATLAHLPYFSARQEAIAFLEKEKINFADVQSFFPNLATIDYIDLNGDTRQFIPYDGHKPYIFFSNVYNVPDAVIDSLYAPASSWQRIHRIQKGQIFVHLYQKKQ